MAPSAPACSVPPGLIARPSTGNTSPAVGAAGSAIRSAAYFDGGGSAGAWLVLAAWALCGIVLAWLGAARTRSTGTRPTLADRPSGSGSRRADLRHSPGARL